MYRDKDQQILKLKEELRTKQEEMTSPSDEFEQREKEMQEQKGTQNQTGVYISKCDTIGSKLFCYGGVGNCAKFIFKIDYE